MSRFTAKSLLPFLLFACVALGCDDTNANEDANFNDEQNALFDPLESNTLLSDLKLPGRWMVYGEDDLGYHWHGYLVVEHAPDAKFNKGFFEWSCFDGAKFKGRGRFQFQGSYDPQTRTVEWAGFSVQDRIGGVVNANYRATLSEDGRRLQNGSWKGGISAPGKWRAEHFGE